MDSVLKSHFVCAVPASSVLLALHTAYSDPSPSQSRPSAESEPSQLRIGRCTDLAPVRIAINVTAAY